MIAAMMTAANLGARLTGWGFAVFVVASVAWIVVGVSSGQTSLIVANAFLTVVNVVGVWRWLGREAKYRDDAADVAARSSHAANHPRRPVSGLLGKPVRDRRGRQVATIVDAILACDDGHVAGLLVRQGGIGGFGERVVVLDRFDLSSGDVTTPLDPDALADLPEAATSAEAAV